MDLRTKTRKHDREREILWLLSLGMSTRQVADQFGLSLSRVRYIQKRAEAETDYETPQMP